MVERAKKTGQNVHLSYNTTLTLASVLHQVHYKQLDGVAMGSPVSPVVAAADIFMDELEKKAFEELEAPPTIWHRFVDDVISVINRSDEAVLLDYLNEQHPRITFTNGTRK